LTTTIRAGADFGQGGQGKSGNIFILIFSFVVIIFRKPPDHPDQKSILLHFLPFSGTRASAKMPHREPAAEPARRDGFGGTGRKAFRRPIITGS
jgi:hypothetical protein